MQRWLDYIIIYLLINIDKIQQKLLKGSLMDPAIRFRFILDCRPDILSLAPVLNLHYSININGAGSNLHNDKQNYKIKLLFFKEKTEWGQYICN